MSIGFHYPAWLVFIIPALALFILRRGMFRAQNLLSLASLSLLVLALSQPYVKDASGGGSVLVVVADRSASMPPASHDRQLEIIRNIEKERKPGDLVAVVAFAEKAFVEQTPSDLPFGGFKGAYDGSASDITAALKTAASLIPDGKSGKIFYIGDGLFTGEDPLKSLAASGRMMPCDFREFRRPRPEDAAVLSLQMPQSVEKGEIFRISAEILAPSGAGQIKYALLRDNKQLVASGIMDPQGETGRIEFHDRCDDEGYRMYSLTIFPEKGDSVPENNKAENVMLVEGAKRILHIGPPGSPLMPLAAGNRLEMENVAPEAAQLSLSKLSSYGSVVIENTAANKLGFAGQEALKAFVLDLGGGLMMTGGKNSFGSGGYFKSPVEEVLPLTLELRREHKKLTTAVVVALDRSGSMGMPAEGGLQKMDLANRGTVAVLDLLTDNDIFGVLAVDSSAHLIQKVGRIGGSRAAIRNRVLSIKSMGGGIFIYEALSNAANMMQGAKAGTRHIVLFADAADSEEPGDYTTLLGILQKNGVSVSVIGLGSEKDCDAPLLNNIASLGGGNVFYSNRAEELPQLFAQDVISVVKGAFVEEDTRLALASDLPLIAQMPGKGAPDVGGYNVCFLKPGASAGIVTADENKTPILAFTEVGRGRSVAFTAELAGEFSGPFRKWKEAGQIFLSCIRWMNPSDEASDAIFTRMRRDEKGAELCIHLDPSRSRDPFRGTPETLVLTESANGIAKARIRMKWDSPHALSAKIASPPAGTSYSYESASDPKGRSISLRAGALRMPYPLEFRPERNPGRGRQFMERLAKTTGGGERITLDGIFETSSASESGRPFWRMLALLSLLAFVAEIAVRRFAPSAGLEDAGMQGMLAASIGRMRRRPSAPGRSTPPASPQTKQSEARSGDGQKPPATQEDAFEKARKRSRKRTR